MVISKQTCQEGRYPMGAMGPVVVGPLGRTTALWFRTQRSHESTRLIGLDWPEPGAACDNRGGVPEPLAKIWRHDAAIAHSVQRPHTPPAVLNKCIFGGGGGSFGKSGANEGGCLLFFCVWREYSVGVGVRFCAERSLKLSFGSKLRTAWGLVGGL
ncbi:hypothetical protein Zmor_004698 [Zophobas morio]|uniref:Uncharacterized protein n=1 Tax=Zophobas morio TaxID=2755281 RepID=A0AA38IRW0_9CUCU|nr:hypothetical protein Zmor_004698 [Zophobas morio]